MLRVAVAFLLVNFAFLAQSHAQSQCSALIDQGCACAIPIDQFDPNTTALLKDTFGDVRVTTNAQFSPANPVTPLAIGDNVVVLEDASALLTFGPTCSRPLPAHSSLVIRAVGDCACAALVELQTQAAATGNSGTGVGVAVGGGLAVAAVVATVLLIDEDEDGDDPVSP